MSGVRDNGILLVDDTGAGGGTSVSIVDPIGQDTMAASVSVVIASDQTPIPVTVPGTIPVSGTVTANQGTPAVVANSWPIKVSNGTNTAQVNPQNTAPSDTSNLMVGGYDQLNNKQQPLPILGNNYDQPDINTRAVSVELRATTQVDGSLKTRNEFVSVGGINNAVTPTGTKLIFADGNTLAIDPSNKYGLQTREMGNSFANSGNISLVGQRFTASSRYVIKAAALFKLVNVGPFIGTIRPVVSLDNGVNFSYCLAINIDTGAAASSFTDALASGTFSIPFGNGATDFGFEITARASGSVTLFVSANTGGVGSIFSITSLAAGTVVDVETGVVAGTPLAGVSLFPMAAANDTNQAAVPRVTNTAPYYTNDGLIIKPALPVPEITQETVINSLFGFAQFNSISGFSSLGIAIFGNTPFTGRLRFVLGGLNSGQSDVPVYLLNENKWITELNLVKTIPSLLLKAPMIPGTVLSVYCDMYIAGAITVDMSASVAEVVSPEPILITGALVSSEAESYASDTFNPLSMTPQGRLRVSAVESLDNQIWDGMEPWKVIKLSDGFSSPWEL